MNKSDHSDHDSLLAIFHGGRRTTILNASRQAPDMQCHLAAVSRSEPVVTTLHRGGFESKFLVRNSPDQTTEMILSSMILMRTMFAASSCNLSDRPPPLDRNPDKRAHSSHSVPFPKNCVVIFGLAGRFRTKFSRSRPISNSFKFNQLENVKSAASSSKILFVASQIKV